MAKKQPQRWAISKEVETVWPQAKREECLTRTLTLAGTPITNMGCPKGLEKLAVSACKLHECPWFITAPWYNNCSHHAAQTREGHTLEEMGHLLNLTRERVRQIETIALKNATKALKKLLEMDPSEKMSDNCYTQGELDEFKIELLPLDSLCKICNASALIPCHHKDLNIVLE